MPTADTVKGAKDHPLLSRFEGGKLVGYDVKAFDQIMLPAGRRSYRRGPQGYYLEKKLGLEGRSPASPTWSRLQRGAQAASIACRTSAVPPVTRVSLSSAQS